MKNIFIVKSPLQLINAIEAKHYFKLNDADCVLIIFGDKKSYPQMLQLMNVSDNWQNVIVLDSISVFTNYKRAIDFNVENESEGKLLALQRGSFFMVKKLNKISRVFQEINFLFVGDNHNSFMRHFINTIKHKKTILIDDGVGAIYMAEIRKSGHVTTPNIRFKKKIKLIAKRFFQGLKDKQTDAVTFFSVYDLDLSHSDELINNRYEYLNEKMVDLDKTGDIYFLGGPLSEVNIMIESDYLAQLKIVRDKYIGKKFIYVAHRRELAEKLDKIRKLGDIDVCHFDYPIEYQVAVIGPVPEIIISFITSAMENMRVIMGERLTLISYRLVGGTYKNENRINSIYRSHEKNISNYFKLESIV